MVSVLPNISPVRESVQEKERAFVLDWLMAFSVIESPEQK
jgi:hypothetical protein